MTALPDRDDEVMAVIAAAMTLPGDERSSYLHVVCGDDEKLREEAADALEWEQRMGGFLQKPWMSLQDLERPFKAGQVVNNRFEIVREIGEGGMGIVYEAYDRKRGRRIAIKSAKLGFHRLLSPELESALKVRHPNICLVNEIHTAATEYGDVDFLTMELLEGPTLRARLPAAPLDADEALEIARQLCAGLAEAHRIGIVHKDLKSANVILARSADGSSRAVITDFGLAGEPANGGGTLAGTPQYMAPELWRGAAASTASDIYALGVILYELVTGVAPFTDEPTETQLARPPAPPSSRVATLDKRWDDIILRCLDRRPAARPDASAVLAMLAKRPIRKLPLLAAAALLLVAAVALRGPVLRYFEPANVRLAILPIEGADEIVALGNGTLSNVADRLTHRGVFVIPPYRALDRSVHTPEQAYKTLDATHVLQVALRRQGGELLARAAVIDLATQTRVEEVSGRYAMSSAGDLSTALTGAVAHALRLHDAADDPISSPATTPYLQGLSYLRRDQHSFEPAIVLFQKAMQLDPHSPLPKAGLVEALVLKYEDTKEKQRLAEADEVLHAAEALNPASVAVLMAAARLDATQSRHEEALRTYKEVAEIQPRNFEVWLRMAAIYDRLDRLKDAVESYQKAIAIDPAAYEPYEELGVCYEERGKYPEAAAQFRKAIALAPNFQEAYTNLGAALNYMGQAQDAAAEQALLTSLKIKETGRALNGLAALRAYQKRDAEAIVLYKKACALNPGSFVSLLNLGDSSRREGLQAQAVDAYRRGSELAQKVLQNNPGSAATRAYVATFAARLGDRVRSQQEIEQALQLAPKDKTVVRRAVLTYEMLGDRERALKILETTTANILPELDRHPDLADFREDRRFKELKAKREKGG